MKRNSLLISSFLLLNALLFNGCINYEQEVQLNADGSGWIHVHYWAKENNVMWLSNSKLAFDEAKVREQYTSPNITIKDIKVELDTKDSTKHVRVQLEFKDINKLSEASGFKDMKVMWEDKGDAQVLTHTLKADTNATQLGMNEYTLMYVYTLPADVLGSNATTSAEKKLTWKYNLSQLSNDITMTATVKKSSMGGSSTTVLIIVALVILVVGGVLFLTRRRS